MNVHINLNNHAESHSNHIQSDHYSQLFRKIYSYCNLASDIQLKDEGLIDPKFNLTKVIVLIRHGDRGPLRPIRNWNQISCDPRQYEYFDEFELKKLNDYIQDVKLNENKLSQNSLSYPLIPNDNHCNLGQLTEYGVLQHLKLGSLLGQLYIRLLNLKSDNEIQLLCTQFVRTFQSASAFLYGFFSQSENLLNFHQFNNMQFVRGIFFCTSSYDFCMKRCDKLEKLKNLMDHSKMSFLESQPPIKRLVYDLGLIISPHENISTQLYQTPVSIWDGLMAYFCHFQKLPCDSKGDCASHDNIGQILSYIKIHGKEMAESHTFRHMNWLKVYGFFNELVKHFNDESDQHKLNLYSAHDLTIVAVSSALGFFDGKLPQYASRVIFELYKHSNNFNYFRIIYNGKDVTGLTEICKMNPYDCLTLKGSNAKLIDVLAFNKYVKDRFEMITNAKNYNDACDL